MRNRVLLAAGTLAAFVPTLLLAQQRPAQPPARPAPQPAQRPRRSRRSTPRRKWSRRSRRIVSSSWELTARVGSVLVGHDQAVTGDEPVLRPAASLRVGYNLNAMWNISVGSGLGFR